MWGPQIPLTAEQAAAGACFLKNDMLFFQKGVLKLYQKLKMFANFKIDHKHKFKLLGIK